MSKRTKRYLVLGDVSYQYDVCRSRRGWLLICELADGHGTRRGVEYLRPPETTAAKITLVHPDGRRRNLDLPDPIQTWHGCFISDELAAHVAGIGGVSDPSTGHSLLAPLAVIQAHEESPMLVETLMSTRLRAAGAVFARVNQRAHPAPFDPADHVVELLANARDYREFLITEWQGWKTFEQGTEIEAKLTLLGDQPIWPLASHVCAAVDEGQFPDFIPDVGNEMQRWEFAQETFEVLGPPSERGYVGLVTNARGTYARRKRFQQDCLRREESFIPDVPAGDRSVYLRSAFPGLTFRELPTFHRTRFDVNVESATTGHFFGIEIDEVTTSDGLHTLRQVEMEYHRSRVHDGLRSDQIDVELERLVGLVSTILERDGVLFERNYYSKLSFLRDTLSAAPAHA